MARKMCCWWPSAARLLALQLCMAALSTASGGRQSEPVGAAQIGGAAGAAFPPACTCTHHRAAAHPIRRRPWGAAAQQRAHAAAGPAQRRPAALADAQRDRHWVPLGALHQGQGHVALRHGDHQVRGLASKACLGGRARPRRVHRRACRRVARVGPGSRRAVLRSRAARLPARPAKRGAGMSRSTTPPSSRTSARCASPSG
jgi:hypothetical protein